MCECTSDNADAIYSLFFRALVSEGHALFFIMQTVIDPSKVLCRRQWHPQFLGVVFCCVDAFVVCWFFWVGEQVEIFLEMFSRQRDCCHDVPRGADFYGWAAAAGVWAEAVERERVQSRVGGPDARP